MKMFNVYAIALALLMVSNGVNAMTSVMPSGTSGMSSGTMDYGMHSGALPSFGFKNDTKQNLFVYIITNDERQAAGIFMSPNDVLPLTIEQWNNIKEVKVRLSGFKHRKEKGHMITDCETGEAENSMALSDLRGNTKFNYLSLFKPTKHGHKGYMLIAIDRAQITAPYQIKGTDYSPCVTCSK